MKAHLQPKTSNLSLGNLYELNKQAMNMENPLIEKEIKEKISNIATFYDNDRMPNINYCMLLCREEYNFTLFNLINCNFSNSSFEQDLYECLINRGEVLSIESDGGNAFEIWIRHDDENVCYYFFPYDNGVIEVQGG